MTSYKPTLLKLERARQKLGLDDQKKLTEMVEEEVVGSGWFDNTFLSPILRRIYMILYTQNHDVLVNIMV